MTTREELNADFDKLQKAALKVKRDRDDLLNACRAAHDALKSYEHGNASTELAKSTAAFVSAAIGRAVAE